MKRVIQIFIVVLILVAGLLAGYLYLGFSNKAIRVNYLVSVTEPSKGELNVLMTVYPEGKPYLHLFLRSPKEQGMDRISNLSVKSNNGSKPIWQTLPGVQESKTIWTGFSKEPIEIRYTLKVSCSKGKYTKLGHLEEDFGYMRVMNALYVPISFNDFKAMLKRENSVDKEMGAATATFNLPEGWKLNFPWFPTDVIPISSFKNVYLGFGDFKVSYIEGEVPISLAVSSRFSEDEKDYYLDNTPVIINTILQMIELKPDRYTPRQTITILPHEPIYGGAAGTGSLLVENDLKILAHEVFHWWNGETIITAKDANWIKEGFTKYYEIKILHKAGLMSDRDFMEQLHKFNDVVRGCDPLSKINLVDASKRLVMEKGEDSDYNRVYFGGATVAYLIDTELMKEGKSLDKMWLLMKSQNKVISSDIFLSILSQYGGEELSSLCKDMIHGLKPIQIDF